MPGIKVIGLREFRMRVIAATRHKPGVVRKGLNAVGQVIVDQALRDFPSALSNDPYNVARRTGALERSLRARSTNTTGKVVEGTPKRVAYAGWWEFGGPKRKSNRPPNRVFVREGRVLYPTLQNVRVQEQIRHDMELVLNALADVIRRG